MRLMGFVTVILIGFGAASAAADDAAPYGTVAAISDIHYDPFAAPSIAERLRDLPIAAWPDALAAAGGPMPDYGSDSNGPLVAAALARFETLAKGADLILLPGDMLGHDFNRKAEAVFGGGAEGLAVKAFAQQTTRAMIAAVAAAAAAPVIFTLGNTDAACGDYAIEPRGAYLAGIADTVRDAARAVADDFDETFRHGGWYAMPHPRLAGGTVIVINALLWSARYENTCGRPGEGKAAADAQLKWLASMLEKAQSSDAPVWIVGHIPLGIDAYSSAAHGAACEKPATAFLQPDAERRLASLMKEHANIIRATFHGHTHHDGYRLFASLDMANGSLAKIVPSISPIFGNNPGLQRFTYDASGTLTGMSTTAFDLSSGGISGWGALTSFAETYGAPFTAKEVREIASGIRSDPSAARSREFAKAYPLGHEPPTGIALRSVACAIDKLDATSFEACLCRRP